MSRQFVKGIPIFFFVVGILVFSEGSSFANSGVVLGVGGLPHSSIIQYGNNYETLPNFVLANCGVSSSKSSYVACNKTYTDSYNAQMKIINNQKTAKSTSEFSRRMVACTGNSGSIGLNFGKMITALRCTVVVAFWPSSSVVLDTVGKFKTAVLTHQPISYIPIGVNFTTSMVKNMQGGASCGSGGIYHALITFPHMTSGLNFTLPCNPPSSMKTIRTLAGIFVWLEFTGWLYRIGMEFLSTKESSIQLAMF